MYEMNVYMYAQHFIIDSIDESVTVSSILVEEDAHAALDVLVLAHENLEIFEVRGYRNARFFAGGQKGPFIFLPIV